MKIHKIINKNIEGIKSEKIKVKTWFCDKDLPSLDSINEETHKGKYVEDILEVSVLLCFRIV